MKSLKPEPPLFEERWEHRGYEIIERRSKAEQIKPAETYSDSYLNELISRRCKA